MDIRVTACSWASCITNLVWVIPALGKLLQNLVLLNAAIERALLKADPPGWQVVNCLIPTTRANDIPFGSVVYQCLCMQIY